MTNKDYIVYGVIGIVGAGALVLIISHKKGKNILGKSEWIKPVVGKLTSPIGYRTDPVSGKTVESHNGQDIAVPLNTKVLAPRDGVVHSTSPSVEGGNQIIIIHDNGWFTGYAHLNKVLVTVNQKVKQGDEIALSGNTGAHTTGPHLHFTMKDEKGTLLDPRNYVYKS